MAAAPGLWVGVPGQCRAHPAEITLLRPAGVPCPNRWPHLTSAIGDLTNLDKGSLLPGPGRTPTVAPPPARQRW